MREKTTEKYNQFIGKKGNEKPVFKNIDETAFSATPPMVQQNSKNFAKPEYGGRYNSKGIYVFPKDSLFYNPKDDSEDENKQQEPDNLTTDSPQKDCKNDIFTRTLSPVLPPKRLTKETKPVLPIINTSIARASRYNTYSQASPLQERMNLMSIRPPQSIQISSHPVLESPVGKAMPLHFCPSKEYLLGVGRYAQVYRASYTKYLESKQQKVNLPCAVKKFFRDDESQARALAEVYVLRKLVGHPYIMDLIAVKDDSEESKMENDIANEFNEESYFPGLLFVLEFCERGNLLEFTTQNPQEVGRLLWFKWAKQLCSAIYYTHSQDIIHHDIKPHNILLTSSLDIRLGDFGNALFLKGATELPTSTGHGRGTDAYTAPELFNSKGTYNFSVDVYSFGVSLFIVGLGKGKQPYEFTVCNESSTPISPTPFSPTQTVSLDGLQMIMWIKKGFWHWVEKEFLASAEESTDPNKQCNQVNSNIFTYPNGEAVQEDVIDLLGLCTEKDSSKRLTLSQIITLLEDFDH